MDMPAKKEGCIGAERNRDDETFPLWNDEKFSE